MKRFKKYCFALVSLLLAIGVIAATTLFHDEFLSLLLGHELNLKGSFMGLLWLRGVVFVIAELIWDRVLWPMSWCEDDVRRIGQIELTKAVVWVALICTALWLVSLALVRACWTGPMGWILSGCSIVMTWFWLACVLFLSLVTFVQMIVRREATVAE